MQFSCWQWNQAQEMILKKFRVHLFLESIYITKIKLHKYIKIHSSDWILPYHRHHFKAWKSKAVLQTNARNWSCPFIQWQITSTFDYGIFEVKLLLETSSETHFIQCCLTTWQGQTPTDQRSCRTQYSTSQWTHLPGSTGAPEEVGCPWPWSLTDRLTYPSEIPAI